MRAQQYKSNKPLINSTQEFLPRRNTESHGVKSKNSKKTLCSSKQTGVDGLQYSVVFIFLKFFILYLVLCVSGCAGAKKESYRILLEEGVALPAITALAWPGADSQNAPCFAFAGDDGLIRVVDVFSGKPLAVFSAGEEKISALVFSSGTELVSLTESGNSVTYSPFENMTLGGEKLAVGGKSFSVADGAICMADSATGKEIARYYFFSQTDDWLCITPEGFYNASSQGAAFVALQVGKERFRLDRLSGALYRPDIFASLIKEETISSLPFTLADLFKKEQLPPLVSLSFDEDARELRIKITEQKGGSGYVALYRHAGEAEIPSGLFDVKTEAAKKYTEKGKTCYEINVNIDYIDTSFQSEIGVSAFNKAYTVESERSWLKLPSLRISSISQAQAEPVLRVLVAEPSEAWEDAEELANIFLLQNEGDLFSNVEAINLFGKDFSKEAFIAACAKFCAQTKRDDVLVICLHGTSNADLLGNLSISPGISGGDEASITGEEILASLLSIPSNSLLLLLDLDSDLPRAKMETALHRFAGRLGPRAVAASFGSGRDGSLFGFIADGLNSGFVMTEPGIKNIYAKELLAYTAMGFQENEGQGKLVFLPMEDFSIIDPFINTGELRFQAMSSGMLRIDQVDKTPVPLAFGDTMIRVLPAGSYIIDLTYRNGYKETRTVELRRKESRWVTFNYTLPYLAGDFSALYGQGGRLPSGGINISELNPATYQKVNREAMEGMGMAPYYVAFLGGEKFYRDGEYDKAIAEYNRCISLKADYAEVYASRGNAYRRKGDVNRAIEDYNRAISLKSSYAEVYNYRGFLFAQRKELRRAVEDYTQAIRYKSDYADAYFNRAHAYGELGNWDLSIADYTQVIKLEPRNWAAYNQRGNAWSSKGDRAKAAEDFAAAERLK
jgi:tetratricopeptide (TPR) repeat protein